LGKINNFGGIKSMKLKNVGKGKVAALISLLVIFVVIFLLVGLIVLQNKEKLLNRSFDKYRVLTAKETFENGLINSNFEIPIFGNPKLVGSDEMRNRYILEILKDGSMKLYMNNVKVEDFEKEYEAIYKKALYNLLQKIPPEDYELSNASALFDYLTVEGYEYLNQDGKEILVLSGKNANSQSVDIQFRFRKVGNNVKITVENITVDGKVFSPAEMRVFLANIYKVDKQSIKSNLVDMIKQGRLKDFSTKTIEEIFGNLNNPRWSIKSEDENVVEFNATDVVDKNEISLSIGFKLESDGSVSVKYIFVNGSEVDSGEAQDILKYYLVKYGGYDLQSELEMFKEKISNASVPGYSKKFGELLIGSCDNISWSIESTMKGTKLTASGVTKVGKNKVTLSFLISSKGAHLINSTIDGNNVNPNELLSRLVDDLGKISSQLEESKYNELISLVQNSIIVKGSQYSSNKSAFERFLRNVSWMFDKNNNKVVLTGTGNYAGQVWQFKFNFEILFGKEVLLEKVYMNDRNVIDEVTDYIIGKIFKVDVLTKNIVELVKNSIYSKKTYYEFLGRNGWSLDTDNDNVVFNNSSLMIRFVVLPNGDVKVTNLSYNGTDYTYMKEEVLKALENEMSIEAFLTNSKGSETKPSTNQTIEQPSKQGTENGTKEESQEEIKPYQF